jgi:hypothetical protein
MPDCLHTASPTETADTVDTVESKRDPQTKRPTDASSAASRTFAWGKPYGPYDWMDAHTPCDDLSSWH